MTPYGIHHVCGQAGFCIKTRNKSDDAKFFINVCHHERIEKPSMKALPDGRQHWSVPNSLGPPRMEKDNCTCWGVMFMMLAWDSPAAAVASCLALILTSPLLPPSSWGSLYNI